MLASVLALTLSVADPLGFPSVAAPAVPASPTSSATSTSTATPTSTSTSTPTSTAIPAPTAVPSAATAAAFTLPESATGLSNLALPAVALALLATVTLLLKRRARAEPRMVKVIETTSLGPKRSLVVARLGDELLVIGASESGLQLLAARPAAEGTAAARLHAVPDVAPAPAPSAAPAGPNPLVTMLARLRGAKAAPEAAAAAPGFDALLAESAEDQELRRKLARGQAGSVR